MILIFLNISASGLAFSDAMQIDTTLLQLRLALVDYLKTYRQQYMTVLTLPRILTYFVSSKNAIWIAIFLET